MTTSSPLVYNVKDSGAVGDGVTDDTSAINTALGLAGATGGVTPIVYFPQGQYEISQLTIPRGVVLQGVHSSAYGVQNPYTMDKPGWPASVLHQIAGSNKDMIVCPAGSNYQRFYDLGFDGNNQHNTAGHGIYISDDSSGSYEAQQHIERCFIFNCYDSGIYLGQHRRAVKVLNSVSNYSTVGDGITVTSSDATIQGCIFGSNARAGINLGTTDSIHWSHFGNNIASGVTHVYDNDIYSNLVGINVASGSWGNMICMNGVDRHHNDGICVYTGTDTIITANTFHSNGIDLDNTYGHIQLGSGVTQCAVSDNNFGPLDGGITNLANYGVYKSGGVGTAVVGNYGVIHSGSVKNMTTNGGLHN